MATRTGRVLRALADTGPRGPEPLALSPNGKWVYESRDDGVYRPNCTSKVSVATGRVRRTAICATALAFSRDARMLAYTRLASRGLVTLLVLRDTRTGWQRTLVASRTCAGCQGSPGFSLAWAPDDRHLAVATATTASLSGLQVLDTRVGDLRSAPAVTGCRSRLGPDCQRPAFDEAGRLIFVRNDSAVVRVNGRDQLTVLHRIPRRCPACSFITYADHGNAFIWASATARRQTVFAWRAGRVTRLFTSSPKYSPALAL